jgi:hypothetical protein
MKDRDAEQQKTDEDIRERKSDTGCTLYVISQSSKGQAANLETYRNMKFC